MTYEIRVKNPIASYQFYARYKSELTLLKFAQVTNIDYAQF